jgi:hypothetical protein
MLVVQWQDRRWMWRATRRGLEPADVRDGWASGVMLGTEGFGAT